MSNENESKELKLEDLEKPLTEQEKKATTGGAGTIGAGGTVITVEGLKKITPTRSRSSN